MHATDILVAVSYMLHGNVYAYSGSPLKGHPQNEDTLLIRTLEQLNIKSLFAP